MRNLSTQHPFALSLSKGRFSFERSASQKEGQGFDKLGPNGPWGSDR